MNFRRLLARSLSLLMISAASTLAQVAIEPFPNQEPSVETKPSATPGKAETTGEEPAPTPAKRSKAKSAEPRAAGDIQDSMTAEEFKAAGLNRLSETELKNLNAWLQGYRQKAETKAAEVAVTEAKKKSKSLFSGEAILSRVADDNFSGVTGHSIIKLEDGSTWKQVNPDDHFKAQVTNRPPARVQHGSFGYKMHIVGVPEFYVDPVR
jgi:hypothetical protein